MESHKPISNNMNITIKIIYNDTQLNYVYLYILPYYEFQIYKYSLQIINSVSCSCLSFWLQIKESHKNK